MKEHREQGKGLREAEEGHPAGSLPAFTDPAFSATPAGGAVQADAPAYAPPPKDTEFAGHPEFSEEAAENEPPDGMGLSEGVEEDEAATSGGVDMPHDEDR